ncbi:MAG TPA: nuclear transport factor 2 family protein [Solirubrobacteraceae bacterium]|nr:nuclear transport factor 2 family protein [Solirubrobacteraceae bacterium]
MSQQNVDCLRRAVELGNAGELDALAELYDAEVELRDLANPPDVPELVHGRTELLAAWARWLDALENWQVDVVEIVDADPWVVCDMRWRATGRESTASTDWRLTDAFEVHDGRIIRQIAGFRDVASALREISKLSS